MVTYPPGDQPICAIGSSVEDYALQETILQTSAGRLQDRKYGSWFEFISPSQLTNYL
jgi:hypothetical protein